MNSWVLIFWLTGNANPTVIDNFVNQDACVDARKDLLEKAPAPAGSWAICVRKRAAAN